LHHAIFTLAIPGFREYSATKPAPEEPTKTARQREAKELLARFQPCDKMER
jgi:hypothetical protein